MNGDNQDPMLLGNLTEQQNYRDSIINIMRDAIEEDRRSRKISSKPETPAILLGGTGLSDGLTQSF